MRYRLAGSEDDAEIRSLLRDAAMAGEIQVTFEREPDFSHGGLIEGDVHQTLIARDERNGILAGVAARSVRDCWVGGETVRLGYLSQLRVAQGYRNLRRLVQGGYEMMHEWHREAGDCDFYVTTIMEDNHPARRLLERGLKGFPTYTRAGELVTLVVPLFRFRGPARGDVQVRVVDATGEADAPEDLKAFVGCLDRFGERHQYAPRWTVEDLLSVERTRDLSPDDMLLAGREGTHSGCAALWDQRAFKQSVIRGYGPTLRWIRPLVNLIAPLLRTHRLPPEGTMLKNAYLSHLGVDDDDPEVFRALLLAAHDMALERGLESLTFSLERRSPLLPVVQENLPYREYVSLIYTVHWEGGEEAAAAARADARLPHLDVAVL